MADTTRIEQLRRRVEKNPASIGFAALAEEYRRAGWFDEAIAACRAGLEHNPAFLSPRVTLGRALIEIGELDQAKVELEYVLNAAPENLAAIRAMAEIHHRQGELSDEAAYSTMAESVAAEPGLHVVAPQQPASEDPVPPEHAPVANAELGVHVQVQASEPASPEPSPLSVAPPAQVAALHAEPLGPSVVPPADVAALPALQKFLAAILAARASRQRASLS